MPSVNILTGDCRKVLPTLASDSVHCVVTSPPYYGLRDYGVVGQLGLEPSPDEYIATMVSVFREVRRVLRADGTCWVNMGDSYSSGTGGDRRLGVWDETRAIARLQVGAKPKDLMLMPARLALALQADGWWVRSDIIWHKPNPMPESVTDRPTSAHEHIYMLSKSARYYYDAEAVRETESPNDRRLQAGLRVTDGDPGDGRRNCRNVWTIATEAFAEAHFATYPTGLVERCIRAGTSERGCCAACGAAWVREVERQKPPLSVRTATRGDGMHGTGFDIDGVKYGSGSKLQKWLNEHPSTTIGWRPLCRCDAGTVPCTVLDPFAGAGTTLLVADRLQRDGIGIELNQVYVEMAQRRIERDAPLFTAWAPPAEDPADARMRDLWAEPENA